MGCGGSKAAGGGASNSGGGGSSASPSASGSSGKGGNKRLLDVYTVGEMLGQGAFGIVYACSPLSEPNKACAVKMVDKVETPVEKITEEADMLKRMDHHNVIRCYDVIYEKCFVCIVMDRLSGGDLIVGMQAHWKSKGKIPVMATVPISAQMASSLHYLHSLSIVHRDVKGDNYLCDHPDITQKDIRIVLTDFGTAVPCKATERLKEKCGTKLYWAPEFYALDYSLKVDVWAMGVVVYGLLNGKFPFRDEKDIRVKQVTVPTGTPQECLNFLLSTLEKKEEKRASTEKLIADPWIAGKVTHTEAGGSGGEDFKPDEAFGENGANAGVQDRRNELVERMQDKRKAPGKSEEHYWKEWFSIVDRNAQNSTLRYEWWSHKKVDDAGLLSLEGATAVNEASTKAAGSTDVVGKQLTAHGIDISKFGTGTAKSLQNLAAEVQSGAAVLMLDAAQHKTLVRVVDVVLLRITAPGKKNVILVETGEEYSDGRKRNITRLPGTKKEPHMNSKQTAEHIMNDMMDLGGRKVTFDFTVKEVFEEQEMSPSYPGVQTVYRKEILEGVMEGDANGYVGQNGAWSRKDKTGHTKFFAWMPEADCAKNGVHYKAPDQGDEVSGLVMAPIGLEVEELGNYLTANNVDVTKFGTAQAKRLKDFSAELIKGESSLMLDEKGAIVRIVDVVVIKLVHGQTGNLLVQTEQKFPDGAKVDLTRFPGSKRRPDENQFLTARRVLKRQLKIDENHVTLDAGGVQVAEEEKDSLAYPGLRTVYRKRIITATLARNN